MFLWLQVLHVYFFMYYASTFIRIPPVFYTYYASTFIPILKRVYGCRYIDAGEFNGVFYNWNFLANYYRNHPEHKVELKLGTLEDYFKYVHMGLYY